MVPPSSAGWGPSTANGSRLTPLTSAASASSIALASFSDAVSPPALPSAPGPPDVPGLPDPPALFALGRVRRLDRRRLDVVELREFLVQVCVSLGLDGIL